MPDVQIFDTHCHYNLEGLSESWQEHWQNAQEKGVVGALVVGTEFASSALAVKIATEEPRFAASIGVHPAEYVETALHQSEEDAFADVQTDMEELELTFDRKVVAAIGETGLDYFRLDQYTDEQKALIKKVQQHGLRAHLKLAAEELPVLLHVRDRQEDAYWDVLNILQEENYKGNFVLHCVSGPLAYVQQAVEMGAYVSVAGNVTYNSAEPLREIVRNVPADRLLIETDAPFLPPGRYRGQRCEPWMIRETANFLAETMKIDLEQCLANSYRVFPGLQ